MIASIKGILIQSSPTFVVIETGGIGYKIFIPISAYSGIPQQGTSVSLHTSFIIRELSHTLYGFLTIQERDFFESLMGVTGVGPKLALAMIGHMTLRELQMAISQSDIPAICRIPGIGKKGAERLVVEMRDKINLTAFNPSDFMVDVKGGSKPEFMSQKINDAMSALINLGYNQITAQKAIKKSLQDLPEDVTLAALITSALSNI